jgi:hypothetical protein
MEAILSSETSVHARSTRRHIKEDGILQEETSLTKRIVDAEINLSLCLINEALCHEDVLGSGVIASSFLTSALDSGVWLASRLSRFTPGESSSG